MHSLFFFGPFVWGIRAGLREVCSAASILRFCVFNNAGTLAALQALFNLELTSDA